MNCVRCAAAHAHAKGSHASGYCDACGWALVLDRQGRETSTLARISPSAALMVVEAATLDRHNRESATPWARTTEMERAILTETIELVSR